MPIVTTGEPARDPRGPLAAGEEPLSVPTCAEAQADGVPCDSVHADCECCGRALEREASLATAPERPE